MNKVLLETVAANPLHSHVQRSHGASLMMMMLSVWLLVTPDLTLRTPAIATPSSDPSTVASSLHEINKLYSSEERVGHPFSDVMADTINVLQLKQVNLEIYSRQGGQMSNARGKVNNILLKSMRPLMPVVDQLYLADTTAADAPSMKAVFDQCMSSLTVLNEANLQVETPRKEACKPTTPRLYKSLITKPGESTTHSMEDQMRSLETKEKLQKALEPERPKLKKTWTPSSQKRHQPYGKGAPKEAKNWKGFPKPSANVNTTSGKPAYSKKKWFTKR